MLRKFLFAIIALLTATAASSAQGNAATLEELVEQANAVCPQKIDKGSALESVAIADNAVEIQISMAITASQIPMLEQNMAMLRPAMLSAMVKSEDVSRLCTIAAEKGYDLRLVISSSTDKDASFAISFSAKELTDAMK